MIRVVRIALRILHSLVKAIDRYEETKHNLGIGPAPIGEARTSALIVANLAALEPVDDGSCGNRPLSLSKRLVFVIFVGRERLPNVPHHFLH